jgi:hypothetical protein
MRTEITRLLRGELPYATVFSERPLWERCFQTLGDRRRLLVKLTDRVREKNAENPAIVRAEQYRAAIDARLNSWLREWEPED